MTRDRVTKLTVAGKVWRVWFNTTGSRIWVAEQYDAQDNAVQTLHAPSRDLAFVYIGLHAYNVVREPYTGKLISR